MATHSGSLDSKSELTLTDLTKKRGVIKGRITKYKRYIESFEGQNLSVDQRAEINLRMHAVASLCSEYAKIQARIEEMLPDSELDSQLDIRDEFETEYFRIQAKAQGLVKDVEIDQKLTNNSVHVKLPTISLPTFDGSCEHWLEFRDMFLSLVHNSKEITNIQKFHYLKSSLKGTAALVIDSLEFSNNNYDIAWELLLNRYNNNRLLIHNHVKALFGLQSLSRESSALIRKLIDTVLKNLRALKLLGEPTDSWDTLIIYMVVSKLDFTTEREWEQRKGSLLPKTTDCKLKLDDLLSFLRDRADVLDTLNVTHSKYIPDTKRNQNYSHTTPKVHCNVLTEKPQDKLQPKKQFRLCPMCAARHPLYSCQSFLDLSVKDKIKLVRDKQLCENCLRIGHTADSCKYGPCRKCDVKHNSLIHRDVTRDKDSTAAAQPHSYSVTTHAHIESNQVSNAYVDVHSTQSLSMQPVLLSTALVDISDSLGVYHKTRAILDSGSERSIISQRMCDKLNIQLIQSTQRIKGVGGSISQCTQTCDIELKSVLDTYHTRVKCLVLPQITSSLPSVTISSTQFRIPDGIFLADPEFYESQPIDLLIGADIFWDLLKDGKIRLNNGPVLQNTQLGWIISGPLNIKNISNRYIHCSFLRATDTIQVSIDEQLRKFWELEDLPCCRANEISCSEDERICEDLFTQTTKRLRNGRFCVCIPFKSSLDQLGDTRKQAEQRFFALERRLQRYPNYKKMYADFIKEYCDLGHMERVVSYGTPHYFMPHHGVFRENAETTRLRVVFDASMVSSAGQSLNDLQFVGPPIQGDLLSILLRFRENRYVACADIEKMYRQVLVDERQRDLQLILWRDSPTDPLQVYKLKTVTYGTASAPYLSCRCLKQLAQETINSDVAQIIKNDFYVDDLICGNSSKDKLKQICYDISDALQAGCFPLRKWLFNFDFSEFNKPVDSMKELSLGYNTQSKTLGIGWHNRADELHYCTKFKSNLNPVTKRNILSSSSQIFDPLGLLSPAIIIAKVLLQKLWLLKLDWDEPVPDEVLYIWQRFVGSLKSISDIRIPRFALCNHPKYLELHIFTDSSLTAYGACAYLRSIDNDNNVLVKLLCSKGKVAPIKPVTIPRLELCGAVVGARLYKKIVDSLRSRFHRIVFWTDSTIVLGWLRVPPNLLKTFVQNRTTEIHELTNNNPWRHVRSEDNPADLISRGRHLDALSHATVWWEGPAFLHDVNIEFNVASSVNESIELPELKSNITHSLVSSPDAEGWFPFTRFSQFNRMKRSAAYILRFVHNARNNKAPRSGALELDELRAAEVLLARLAQRDSYPDIYYCLLNGKSLNGKPANLTKLNLFIDSDNIIRVGGRIENSSTFSYEKKHPILISCKHNFATLLFRYEHRKLLHAPPQLLLFTIRETWWPVGARNLARQTARDCVTCKRFQGKTLTPIMGNLPKQRLEPGCPFLYCGVDYAGPVLILNRKGRGAKTVKSYICLFTCFVTRAIHLELVSDLTSDAYLLALKRFISRRGKPAEIFSDNGKNFVGLKNEFAMFLSKLSGDIKDYALTENIKFHMSPPYASHFGGIWESGVKSCKHHLRRVIGNAHLTFEEFSTVLTQIEAVLNSRPLTPMSTDPHDFLPLSPAHFLVGRPLTAPVCADLINVPVHSLTRYHRVEQIRQHFWVRWSKEYVSELQARSKWRFRTDDLKENTLVIIKEDHTPPLKWNLGRILKTYPGKDGVSRVADIRTATGTVRRAFSKICPLFHADQE